MPNKYFDFRFLICGFLSLFLTHNLSAQDESGSVELDQLKKNVEAQYDMYLKETQKLMNMKEDLNGLDTKISDADSKINELNIKLTAPVAKDSETIKKMEEQQLADTTLFYQKKFSTMASNFLYLPYNRYSIDEIAIPAYDAIKGSELYIQRAIRLQLLKSYREDIESLIEYISDMEPKLDKLTGIFKMATVTIKNNKWLELKNSLNSLRFVREYQKYTDWKETYLGKQYLAIAGMLGGDNPASTKAGMTKIKENLQSLLQD